MLLTGYYYIRQRNVAAHRRCMLAALGSSGLFLISYLVYHFSVGSVRFQGQGWIRMMYFAVLVSHTVLRHGYRTPGPRHGGAGAGRTV